MTTFGAEKEKMTKMEKKNRRANQITKFFRMYRPVVSFIHSFFLGKFFFVSFPDYYDDGAFFHDLEARSDITYMYQSSITHLTFWVYFVSAFFFVVVVHVVPFTPSARKGQGRGIRGVRNRASQAQAGIHTCQGMYGCAQGGIG